MACSWIWLAGALDSSLATRTLLTSLDADVLIDLATHHGDSLSMLLLSAAILAFAGSMLWIWVNGAVLAAVIGSHESMSAACRAGAVEYFQLLKLWIAAATSYVLIGIAVIFAERRLTRWAADSPDEMTRYWILAGCILVGGAAVALISTIHDHARIRCLASGESGGRAGLWACAYVAGERRTVTLTLALAFTSLMIWIVYQAGATLVTANSEVGLTVSLVLAQAFMAARALVRVWAFAAASDLQGSADTVA
jgi:hypothetical protein